MAEVELIQVRKEFARGVAAVRDVSLRVAHGQLAVLVGPSGCGKTTTLRMIAGLETPTSGEIRIGGRDVSRTPPRDRDIAMVFQNYALYPHMTVRQNMSFALRVRGVKRGEITRRVDEAARLLGLEDLMRRKPRELSGGQRQRVAVGRAIVREPAVFLFDEPLSNLDAKLRVTMRGEIKALHQRLGATMVYVTHDQEEAMSLGDVVVVMGQGEVRQEGPPLEVYRRPANRFVAGFVGSPPMNLLTGSLTRLPTGRVAFQEAPVGGRPGAEVVIAFPEERSTRLAGLGARPVVLGLRPQMLALAAGGEGCLALPVRVVEPLGEHMDVTLGAPGRVPLVARVPSGQAADLRPGVVVSVRPDMNAAHLFEPGEPGRVIDDR